MLKLINSFFLVRLSPYPLLLGISSGNILLSLIISEKSYLILSILLMTFISLGWLNEIRLESSIEGGHSREQDKMLYLGFVLFLVSEVLIFATLFGSFFYNSISPSIEIYNKYPYFGINTINYYSLPLVNTLLLYMSGLTCTIALSYLGLRKKIISIRYLLYTIILSISFTYFQYVEYNNSLFSIIDGIYGTNFFILTGFHGIHVFIGTLFIIYSLMRIIMNTARLNHNVGLIASSLYWHFVDYVWILLYITIYFWGS